MLEKNTICQKGKLIMNMNIMLRKMAVLLERKKNSLFSYDVDKQKNYIAKLGNPRDKIERSYFQYKCQMKLNGKVITFFLTLVSLPMILIYLKKYGKETKINKLENNNLVFFRDGKPENILPKSIKVRYQNIVSYPDEKILLTSQDRNFIKKIIYRYPFSWHFILKSIIKIGKYNFVIEKYSPEAIVVCAEYSFTSSLLTAYCQKRRIKHINVMHGEKLYYMRDSFFEFDECYIWDEYYEKLFSSLNAERKQFIVEIPTSLYFDENLIRTNIFDFTYYLGAESEEVLKRIAEILMQLYINGYKISIRPHPRYSNIEIVKKMFAFAFIENTKKITIEKSLSQTGAAISLYSTVLNQALCNSVSIIIDDMSNPSNFNRLKELDYVCFYKKYKLLSDVIKENT